MKAIEFSKQETADMAGELQRYFRDELDLELGALPAQMLVDFLGRTMGPYFYNRALYDAQAVLTARVEDISEAILALERASASKR